LILFCDTSALVKLYIREDFTDAVLAAADSAEAIVVCRIAWAEIMAALARRVRECPSDADVIDVVRSRIRNDWNDYAIVEVTQSLVELAGEYADTFALRGYDSVQLAASRVLQEASGEPVLFACFDARLQKAAKVLGMHAV
jgi:predicted nucleic acid-binding protein